MYMNQAFENFCPVHQWLFKIINQRLTTSLEKNKSFSASQYGFEEKTDTQSAVPDLMNKIAEETNTKSNPVGLFLAFDTVKEKDIVIYFLMNWKKLV